MCGGGQSHGFRLEKKIKKKTSVFYLDYNSAAKAAVISI